jgi:hypothetical protein
MKYYGELSNIETQIIRLDAMSSVLRVISNGAEHSSDEDVRNALWYIEGSIEDIRDDDTPKEKHKGGMKKKKMMTDRELP